MKNFFARTQTESRASGRGLGSTRFCDSSKCYRFKADSHDIPRLNCFPLARSVTFIVNAVLALDDARIFYFILKKSISTSLQRGYLYL